MRSSELKNLTLERLLIQLQAGSPHDATPYVRELVERFEPLLRVSWRRLAFDMEYEEFVQDVFVRLFSSLPRLKNPKAFPGYFRRIVVSVAIDESRRKQSIEFRYPENPSRIASLVDRVLLGRIFVRSYLEHLPPRQREVIDLEFLRGLSDEEIAEAVEMSPSGVRATRSPGLKKLRTIIRQDGKALQARPTKG